MYHQRMIEAVEDLKSEDIQGALSTYLSSAPFVDFKGGDTSAFESGDGGDGG